MRAGSFQWAAGWLLVLLFGSTSLMAQDSVCSAFSAAGYLERGQSAQASANYVEAIEHFNCVTKLTPNNARAHQLLGDIYYDLDYKDSALEAYRAYISLTEGQAEDYVASRIDQLDGDNTMRTLATGAVAFQLLLTALPILVFAWAFFVIFRSQPWRWLGHIAAGLNMLRGINRDEWQIMAESLQHRADTLDLKNMQLPDEDDEDGWVAFVESKEFARIWDLLQSLPLDAFRQAGIDIPDDNELKDKIEHAVMRSRQRKRPDADYNEDDGPIQWL